MVARELKKQFLDSKIFTVEVKWFDKWDDCQVRVLVSPVKNAQRGFSRSVK
jgi:hypothetical protein